MFEKLKEGIRRFSRLSLATKEEVEGLIKELQRELLKADVEVELVFDLSNKIKKEALKKEVPKGLTRKEHVLNLVYKELVKFLGEEPKLDFKEGKILLCGLYGSGKTTTCGKIANFYRKRGKKVGLISGDVYRPAAFEQLEQIAKKINVEFYGEKKSKDPLKVISNGLKELNKKKCDIVIIDSAGRSSLDYSLINELREISNTFKLNEKYLIVPSDIGQAAGEQAKAFNKAVGLTGVIVTKTDSTSKAGGSFTSCFHAKVPVVFIGTGEKIENFELYNPVKFVSKMLGFPDLRSLLEKAKEGVDEEGAKKIMKGKFTLKEFYEQLAGAKKSGMLSQIKEFFPFPAKIPKDLFDIQEGKIETFKYIIDSMTPEERENPDVINRSRVTRITKGSGTSEKEVRELLKTYRQVKNLMGKFSGKSLRRGPIKKLMKQFGLS